MRRTWAVAILTYREALHNKVLLSCAFFALTVVLVRLGVFAVGGRELWVNVEQFTQIALLLILLTGIVVTIVLVAPSLSADIRTKVIHTIIPKPIHRVEILLGKVLGFTAVAGLILVIIGATTWAVVRITVHGKSEKGTRRLLAAEVRTAPNGIRYFGGYQPYMKRSDRRWINPDWIESEEDRQQRESEQRAKPEPGWAVVSFNRIGPRDLWEGQVRLEINVGAYKFGGAAGQNPEVSLVITNRATGEKRLVGRTGPADTDNEPFIIAEDAPRRLTLPAAFIGDGAPIDIEIHNYTPKLRVGVQQTDVALLSADRPYEVNFLKGLFILFLEVFLVVVIAVMSSTFLSGQIAILFTSVVWIGGHLLGYMGDLLTAYQYGGRGPMADLAKEFGRSDFSPRGPFDFIIDFGNAVLNGVLTATAHIFPNFGHSAGAWLLTRNVDIPGTMVWQALEFTLFYALICFIVAWVSFWVKEVAR